jgi:mannosyl-oligosaccharide alpha-1,2-mannosidase
MPDRPGVPIIGTRQRGSPLQPEQQHLSTFAGGMFGLGAKLLGRRKDMATAIALTDGAVWAYASTASGLMPEISKEYLTSTAAQLTSRIQ